MELLLTVTATDGRLIGTARRPGTSAAVFSGSLELLACLERLAATDTTEPTDQPRTEPLPAPLTTEGH